MMNDQQEQDKNIEIALWLGYRQHAQFHNNWFLPGAPAEHAHAHETIPLPDFHNSPAHYERIKARLRDLDCDYDLNYRQTEQYPSWSDIFRLSFAGKPGTFGTMYGPTEGDVLVQCALQLIKRGIK